MTMTLVFGGAYQGKLAYVTERFGVSDRDISRCGEDGTFDPAAPVVVGLERFSLACVRAGKEPLDELCARCADRSGKVFVADDISCGIVPIDPVLREWREAHGRMMNALSREADGVVRLFCGIPQVLK
jgi:hypothetical protein